MAIPTDVSGNSTLNAQRMVALSRLGKTVIDKSNE